MNYTNLQIKKQRKDYTTVVELERDIFIEANLVYRELFPDSLLDMKMAVKGRSHNGSFEMKAPFELDYVTDQIPTDKFSWEYKQELRYKIIPDDVESGCTILYFLFENMDNTQWMIELLEECSKGQSPL